MANPFVRLTVVLMLISGLASGALALVDSFTAPRIKAAQEAALQQALTQALPGATEFKEDREFLTLARQSDRSYDAALAFYRASAEDGSAAGVVVTVAPAGYGGPITTMVGIGSDGEVKAARVLSQSETPGLGVKVTRDEFLQSFIGAKTGETLAVNKDGGRIAAIAGATISSRAVTRAVNIALSLADRSGIQEVSP